MEDEETRWQKAASHLLGVCASAGAVAPQVLPALDADNSSKLLKCLSIGTGGRHHEEADAPAVFKSVKYALRCSNVVSASVDFWCRYVLKAINANVSGCSDIIKARVARSCVSLCSSGIRILLLSATSTAHCFALSQADFERAFDDTAAAGCIADKLVHDRKKIGRNLREALQEALSEAMTPSHADVLAYGIMLSLLREIDKTLLMSVFHFQLRCGNDASCRSLARVQERDVLHLLFAAAKDHGDTGDGTTAAAALRLAQSLRKHLGDVEGDLLVTQTQQQKDAAFAAQQSNVSRLLRANKLTTAAVYSSCSAQHAQQLQRHFLRVLCSMNMLHDAMHHAEEWGIQKEIDVQLMLQECTLALASGLGSIAEGYLQLPDSFRIVTVCDASDALQAAEVAAVLGMGDDGESISPAVAIDVEWPCADWDIGGRASILQVASFSGCIIFDLDGICRSVSSIDAFSSMMTRLLMSSRCTKLFYGCHQDMRKLRSSWPAVKAFEVGARRCLELNHLAATVRVDLRNKSLNEVCLAFLGQPLNKKQRLSNWALRPLTSEQMSYAALDVYAPILIFRNLLASHCDSQSGEAAATGCEWFESLYFDLPAEHVSEDGGFDMAFVPDNPHAPIDEFVLQNAATVWSEVIQIPMADGLDAADDSDAAALPLESAAVDLSDLGVDSIHLSNPVESSDPLICLGTLDVVAALENCKLSGMAYELTDVPSDVEGDLGVAASKFAVFDRIQLHADSVGMTRHQVIRTTLMLASILNSYVLHVLKTLCLLVKTPGAVVRRYAVVMIGDMFLDMTKVASAVGCSRRHLQLAPAPLVLQLFGYRIGSVPPVGFLPGERDGMGVRVMMDKSVRSLGPNCCVLVGGGNPDIVLKISVDNLLHVIAYENAKFDMRDMETIFDLCRSNNHLGTAVLPAPIVNLSNSRNPESFLRFACDASIARAGKWLRAMGVDCILIDIPSIDSIQMVLAEGRLFLSADRKLVDKREFYKSSVVLVLGTDAKDQLLEIVRHFKIVYSPERFLVRCVFCNTEAFEELSPEEAIVADLHGSMCRRSRCAQAANASFGEDRSSKIPKSTSWIS